MGHIEDIAVLEDQQGRKLGLHLLHALGYIAQKVGCYKVSTSTCLSPLASFCSEFFWGGSANPGLLRKERGILRQVRLQAGGIRNGTI